jgi:hypothetical protein
MHHHSILGFGGSDFILNASKWYSHKTTGSIAQGPYKWYSQGPFVVVSHKIHHNTNAWTMKPQGPFPRRLMSPLVPEKDAKDSNPEPGSNGEFRAPNGTQVKSHRIHGAGTRWCPIVS